MFMNINFTGTMMGGNRNNIDEISKFYKIGQNIIQKKWSNVDKDRVSYLELTAEHDTKKIKQIAVNNLSAKWPDFISKIPENIEKYIYFYPCFLMVNANNWVDSIITNSAIYGITNAGKTKISKTGDVFLDKDGQSLNDRMVDPKQLIRDIVSGKQTFVPHIDERVSTPIPSQPEVEPQPKLVRY